jgi:hypothetical protein
VSFLAPAKLVVPTNECIARANANVWVSNSHSRSPTLSKSPCQSNAQFFNFLDQFKLPFSPQKIFHFLTTVFGCVVRVKFRLVPCSPSAIHSDPSSLCCIEDPISLIFHSIQILRPQAPPTLSVGRLPLALP